MSAEAERKTETIPEWKREEVDEIVGILDSYDSVGVVDITGIPSRQLQDMRRDLYGTAQLRVSRNTLLIRALEEVDEGLEELTEFVSGQVGLIGTNDNPFALFRELEASKTPAPINAGEVAPNDIVIPAGDTGIDPGPFVGELQQVGANARIDEGSIKVLEDSTVLETGEEVDAQLANVLTELEIEPKEVGLDLRAVYADGVRFEPDELELDVEQYEADVRAGAGRAWNLAVNAEVPTDATATTLLQTARGEAKAVAIQAAVEDPDVVPELVSKADAQVRAIAAGIEDEDALPEELRDVDAPGAGGSEQATEQDEAEGADAEDEPGEEEEADEEEEAGEEAAADDESDDDDADAAGDALGEMF